MPNYSQERNISSTKHDCSSPATTKSESYSRNGRVNNNKAEEHDDIISPISASRRSTDVRGIIAPSRRDQQLMRQVSGLDLDDFDKQENGGPVDGGIILTGPASEIGGIIAPTNRQKQLMRQVSGLGLEDPIFGKNLHLDDSMNKEHASFFFEDMDINDIPEDMRDMFSLASDRTDVVDTDLDVQSYDSKSFGSLPPLGLEDNAAPQTKKVLRKGKKPRRKSHDQSTTRSVTSEDMYVPPAPAFVNKRRNSKDDRRGGSGGSVTSHDMALAVDKALAAQVDALLTMNESKHSRDFSSHSRGSFTGHSRTSQTGHSRVLKKGTRPKPLRQDSRFSVNSSSAYVPPSLHSEGASQRGERHMPESMDEIFASKQPTTSRRVKKKKSTRSTEEKKKKKKAKAKPLKLPKDPDWEVS